MIQVTRQLLPAILALSMLPALPKAQSQVRREDIHTDFVLYQKRVSLEKDLRERIIGRNFDLPLDSNTEDKYLSACSAVSQFGFDGAPVFSGFDRLFKGYAEVSYDVKKAFLEAVYAVGSTRFADPMRSLLMTENNPRLFSMAAVYCYRSDTSTANANALKIAMVEKFPGYDSFPILQTLEQYLSYGAAAPRIRTPDIPSLFNYHRTLGKKIVYSFQRWDRDYPGLAIVMDEQGRFIRDAQGRVRTFRQLARSGSSLPYFISDGNTPQGIFSITGTAVSRTNFIGPTPNLQLIMPFEETWDHFFFADSATASSSFDSLAAYTALLPSSWRGYAPMMEAWTAGRLGRTEIIAHGTTIDPEYFHDKPYYPLTPTMGCLCAKEEWNVTTGHPLVSEQLDLFNAFSATPVRKGYLVVINVDDRRAPLSREEIEAWIKRADTEK